MCPVKCRADGCMLSPLFETERTVQAYVVTGTDTTAAEDAEIVVSVVKRIVFFDRETSVIHRVRCLGKADLFRDRLKLTAVVIGTVPATSRYTHLSDRSLIFFAFIMFRAEQTACRMLAEKEFKHFLT